MKTCHDCIHCDEWTEHGELFSDCLLAKWDEDKWGYQEKASTCESFNANLCASCHKMVQLCSCGEGLEVCLEEI